MLTPAPFPSIARNRMASPASARRLRYLLLAWAALVPYPGHAQPQSSDVFNTVGQYDRFAVGNAHRWYDKHSTEAKQKSSQCLSILDEAKAIQDAALALDEEARQPGFRRSPDHGAP